ncbi:DUF2637 domain-containing protein [Arthrobacter sp. MPF02]|uniref:DUF2637 domain-containing protein n=1 Tax=Arthrobacter sp. MPF02 TaxID=3388492 RepID=UPI003984E62B
MSARIEPDGRTMMLLSLGLVAVLAVASSTLSFLGLIQAAAWAGIPEQLRWLVPIVVDATILVYAVAASVQRARGESTPFPGSLSASSRPSPSPQTRPTCWHPEASSPS